MFTTIQNKRKQIFHQSDFPIPIHYNLYFYRKIIFIFELKLKFILKINNIFKIKFNSI